MTQLPLQLSLPPRFGAQDFLVSPSNAAAHATIERWPDWPDRVLLLIGPAGSGKSHLAHVWAAQSKARILSGIDIAGDLSACVETAAVIDGAERLALPEAPLFHLLNLVREKGSWLLVTARQPADRWNLSTPDLLSRLRLAPSVTIEAPDEALVRMVLVKLFDDRQIRVDAGLIDYLTLRVDRSLGAVRSVVERLDALGLSQGRRITRAMAFDVLRALQLDPD